MHSFWIGLAQRGGGELGVTQISEFLENESLVTNFAESQQVDDLL